jgi:hypothetical protein
MLKSILSVWLFSQLPLVPEMLIIFYPGGHRVLTKLIRNFNLYAFFARCVRNESRWGSSCLSASFNSRTVGQILLKILRILCHWNLPYILAFNILQLTIQTCLTHYLLGQDQQSAKVLGLYIVTCIPIARQRLGKHISSKRTRATEGHPLIGTGPVNMPH